MTPSLKFMIHNFKFRKISAVAIMAFMGASASAQLNLGNLGDMINTAGKAIQNVTATTKFTAQDLVGTWKYSSPGVNFDGDNALSNIGGAAASGVIENKLAPYYKTAGIDKLTLTVNKDLTFKMGMGSKQLSGTIAKEKGGNLVFKFAAFNKINIGTIECIATKSGNMLNLTFNASKMLKLAQTVSSISSNSTFQTVNSLLKNYDGLFIGAKMKRTSK